MAEPTTQKPLYRKAPHNDSGATQLYMITCDEGWRQSIVCERMYDWAADWLIKQVQGRPYLPEPEHQPF